MSTHIHLHLHIDPRIADMLTPDEPDTIARAVDQSLIDRRTEDQHLLQTLSDMRDDTPTPTELLDEVQYRWPDMFRHWGPGSISKRLAAYGIRSRRSALRREFYITADRLRDISDRHGLDLRISDSD